MLGVTLRRSIGALAASALAVAVLTAGDMTVTDLLGIRTYAEEAYVRFQLGQGPGVAATVSLPPLIVLGTLILIGSRGLMGADPARLPSAAPRAKTWRLGRWRTPLGLALAIGAGNAVALPLYGLIWRAGRVGGSAGVGPRWSASGLIGTLRLAWSDAAGPLLASATWAALAASATIALAWPLAWAARRPGLWRWAAGIAVALPLATPGPIAGMALVLAYNAAPPGPDASILARAIFQLRVAIYDTPAILVLAYVLRTLPYALLVLWPALRSLPEVYLEAATLEGYGPWGRTRRIALPMTRRPLLAAWGVAFVLALGELPAANLVCPPGTTPISVVIWGLLHTGVESHLAGVGLLMLAAVLPAGAIAAVGLGAPNSRRNPFVKYLKSQI